MLSIAVKKLKYSNYLVVCKYFIHTESLVVYVIDYRVLYVGMSHLTIGAHFSKVMT